MLSKKQYYWMLIGAAVGFILVFTIAFIYSYQIGKDSIKPNKQVTDITQEVAATNVVEASKEPVITIQKDTAIVIDIMDYEHQLLSTQVLKAEDFIGNTQEQLQERFKEYDIKEFSARKVVLVRTLLQEEAKATYKLGAEKDVIGIVEETKGNNSFRSLGISLQDFSKQTSLLFKKQLIEITKSQKEMLEKDPYYVEQILQSYSE